MISESAIHEVAMVNNSEYRRKWHIERCLDQIFEEMLTETKNPEARLKMFVDMGARALEKS